MRTLRTVSLTLLLALLALPVAAQNPVVVYDFGAQVDQNAGNASANTLRVVVASDQAAIPASQSGNFLVQGIVANDAVYSGNPLPLGCYASAAAPADVSADGDLARMWCLRNGALAVNFTNTSIQVSNFPTVVGSAIAVRCVDTTGSSFEACGGGGSGSNAAASATGSAVPASASYTGINVSGTHRGWTGLSLGSHYAGTVAIVDGSGNQITSFGGSGGTASNFTSAFPASGTAAGFNDGTNMQGARVFDGDSGAGSQYILGVGLRKTASGGTVEAGTSSDPLRVDPTGTTAQPVTDNGGSLTVDVGTALPAGTNNIGDVDVLSLPVKRQYAGTAQTVINTGTDIAASNFSGAPSATFDNTTDASYPYAKRALAVLQAPDWAAAPAAGTVVDLYGVVLDVDSTSDETDAPSGTSAGGAHYFGSWAIAAADALQRRAILINVEGYLKIDFYIRNGTAQNMNNDAGTNATVKITPVTDN